MGNQSANSSETALRSTTLLPVWEMFALFIGDFATLIVFGVWGQFTHNLLADSEAPVRAVINTAAPFMLSWLAASAAAGTYRQTGLHPLTRTIWKTLLAGLLGGPLGVVLWALWRGHWPGWIFYVVTTGISTLMLLAWRVLWSRFRRLWWPEL